jgi:hypothetical protein
LYTLLGSAGKIINSEQSLPVQPGSQSQLLPFQLPLKLQFWALSG